MFLSISSLNSGSNGNCYYIGNEHEAILIDAGLSCRETEKRMAGLRLSMKKIKAIFISHEHTDHIKGLNNIVEKYQIPVFISTLTANKTTLTFDQKLVRELKAENDITIGNIKITGFSKFHDAVDPMSFIICSGNTTVGVFTDIGKPCEQVRSSFSRCNAAFLESNYDDMLLESGNYPTFLKNRIRGGMGHLSNNQALEVFNSHRPPFMSHLILSHLSKENNCPIKVKKLFSENANGTEIIVASRYEPSPIYLIKPNGMDRPHSIKIPLKFSQLSFFE